MAADGEVARDAGRAQLLRQLAELRQEELEDEREPDHQRLARRQPRGDLPPAVTHVDHLDRAAVPLQHGRQVSHAEIALVLIADKRDLCAAVSGGGRLAGVAESLAPSAATHGL